MIGAGVGGLTLGFVAMAADQGCEEGEWACFEVSSGNLFMGGALLGAVQVN